MTRTVKPLNNLQIKNARAGEKSYKLFDGAGLFLDITPHGSKHWRMKYTRPDKKISTLSFGRYLEISLEQARKFRQEARQLLAIGIDPYENKKEQQYSKLLESEIIFERVAREWYETHLDRWQPSTAKDIIYRLEKDIFPAIGKMPINKLNHRKIIETLKGIQKRGAMEIAKRLRANLERIFRYAIQYGYTDRNLAADLTEVLAPAPKGHFAAITSEELPEFIKQLLLNDARLYKITKVALHLLLLLFPRTSELITTPWSELNLETGEWIIPWQRMKMGKKKINPVKTAHDMCMSHQALDLLRDLHRTTGGNIWLFPNQRDPSQPMSNGAILRALDRLGYPPGLEWNGWWLS